MDAATSQRSRRIRALLAGGLVLGVGVITTLAVWNDNIFERGSFEAGGFALEGSADAGATWLAYGSVAEAAVLFQEENLQQDTSYYSDFWVRIAAGEQVLGAVQLTLPAVIAGTGEPPVLGGNEDFLNYAIYDITAAGNCSAGNLGTAPLVWSGNIGAETVTVEGVLPELTGGGESAGAPVKLCFVVSTTADLKAMLAASGTWKLLGSELTP